MSQSNFNETFVLACLGAILAAPFLFRLWLNQYPLRTMESVDKATGNFSTVIFVALFIGGFVFDDSSRKAGMVLLLASIFSFYVLYQSRYRYLKGETAKKAQVKPVSSRVAFGKIAYAGIFFALICLMAKVPYLLPVIFLAYPFATPYFVRLQNDCTPLANSALKTEIFAVFQKARVKLSNVYIINNEGTHSDAMMANHTLFVTMALFEKLNEEEIKAVISHEAAHLKERHLWKRVAASALFFGLGVFWILFPAAFMITDPKQIFVTIPFIAAFQWYWLGRTIRKQEYQADHGAVNLGASSEALISAIQKLSGETTQMPKSGLFSLNFHPSNADRIESIQTGEVPRKAIFSYKKYAYAYSLLVVGFVFHEAQTVQRDVNRKLASVTTSITEDAAKVSHPAATEQTR